MFLTTIRLQDIILRVNLNLSGLTPERLEVDLFFLRCNPGTSTADAHRWSNDMAATFHVFMSGFDLTNIFDQSQVLELGETLLPLIDSSLLDVPYETIDLPTLCKAQDSREVHLPEEMFGLLLPMLCEAHNSPEYAEYMAALHAAQA